MLTGQWLTTAATPTLTASVPANFFEQPTVVQIHHRPRHHGFARERLLPHDLPVQATVTEEAAQPEADGLKGERFLRVARRPEHASRDFR
jgi:hypothetical protein